MASFRSERACKQRPDRLIGLILLGNNAVNITAAALVTILAQRLGGQGAVLVATFVLILVGGVVRVSDSGLGCGPAGSGFHGWPFCVANNSPANSSYKWDYAAGATTGEQYDCSLANIPSDLDYAPAGQSNPGPTFEGQANIPGPAVPATIWKSRA